MGGGRKVGFPDLWSDQKPWRKWYLTAAARCGEFRWSPKVSVNQIHSPHLEVGHAPGIFSDFLRSVQMLKREWGAEGNGKLPHLFNLW